MPATGASAHTGITEAHGRRMVWNAAIPIDIRAPAAAWVTNLLAGEAAVCPYGGSAQVADR
jgi:hypothetical protein